ncbi:MAG TPA: hypothetical protein VN372_04820 [Methanospirillum sp.]|nr:hypothetical protein [Methanospirillum sp.]
MPKEPGNAALLLSDADENVTASIVQVSGIVPWEYYGGALLTEYHNNTKNIAVGELGAT